MRMRRIPKGISLGFMRENLTTENKTLSYDLWVCEFLITQELFSQYMNNEKPSYFNHAANLPVEYVTWHDAAMFANALSRSENLPRAFEYKDGWFLCVSDYTNSKGYRLPTDEEHSFYAKDSYDVSQNGAMLDYSWNQQNSKGKTHPVGLKLPNKWGLYDTLGNVYEKTAEGSCLGGYFGSDLRYGGRSLSCMDKENISMNTRSRSVGFRLVMTKH